MYTSRTKTSCSKSTCHQGSFCELVRLQVSVGELKRLPSVAKEGSFTTPDWEVGFL